MEIQKIYINDGDKVEKDFVNEWDIWDYCDQLNGVLSISFVGCVIKNNKILLSYPKHYDIESLDETELTQCIKKIMTLITINRNSQGNGERGSKEEFPINGYLDVLSYFKKFGLYKSTIELEKKGFSGRINWIKTINKSNKIIQDKGVVFFPFILSKKEDISVFISECMMYVLSDASKYSNYIEAIEPYKNYPRNKVFTNISKVITVLNSIKNNYFKDSEIKLIYGLIDYFQWKGRPNNNFRILTLHFENYWESLVGIYLSSEFHGYEKDKIIWKDNARRYIFTKPKSEFVESDIIRKEIGRKNYRIQFDHYLQLDKERKIFVFDSKYFNGEVESLNYKQLFYGYHLKQKFPDYEIINGLIAPSSFEYYTKIHIDRIDLDGQKIIEHYVNLRAVIEFGVQNRNLFERSLRKFSKERRDAK